MLTQPMIYPNDPQWRFYLIFAHGPPLTTMLDPWMVLSAHKKVDVALEMVGRNKCSTYLISKKICCYKKVLLTGYNLPWRQDIPSKKNHYSCKKTIMCGRMQYMLSWSSASLSLLLCDHGCRPKLFELQVPNSSPPKESQNIVFFFVWL